MRAMLAIQTDPGHCESRKTEEASNDKRILDYGGYFIRQRMEQPCM